MVEEVAAHLAGRYQMDGSDSGQLGDGSKEGLNGGPPRRA
jgi:hypothetical protein